MGEPTSSAPSGVIVAALMPKPASRIAARGVDDDLVFGRAALLEREVEVLEIDVDARSPPDRGRAAPASSSSWPVWSPSRTTMATGSGMAPTISAARRGPYAGPMSAEHCSWCGEPVPVDDGFRAFEPIGERRAVFCRLEHVVPWAIRGAHWAPAAIAAGELRDGLEPECAQCGVALTDTRVLLVSATAVSTGSPMGSAASDHLAGVGEGRRPLGLRLARQAGTTAGRSVERRRKPTAIPSVPTAAATTNASRQPIEATMPPEAALPAATPPTSEVSGHV